MERTEFGHKFEDWEGIDPTTGAEIMGWKAAEGNPVVVTPPAHLHNAWRVWEQLREVKPQSFTGELGEDAAFSHAIALAGQK